MLIQGLRVFDQVMALTDGGPGGATETLATQVYKETFALVQLRLRRRARAHADRHHPRLLGAPAAGHPGPDRTGATMFRYTKATAAARSARLDRRAAEPAARSTSWSSPPSSPTTELLTTTSSAPPSRPTVENFTEVLHRRRPDQHPAGPDEQRGHHRRQHPRPGRLRLAGRVRARPHHPPLGQRRVLPVPRRDHPARPARA